MLLLDEITVDLDVLGRADLLAYLRAETEERGACIVYATHIFDGLESWATHLMYLANGGLKVREQMGDAQRGALQGPILRPHLLQRNNETAKREDSLVSALNFVRQVTQARQALYGEGCTPLQGTGPG